MTWAHMRKALVAGFLAAFAYGTKAYPGGFTPQEIGDMVGLAVAAGIGVYWTPNKIADTKETVND